MENELSVNSLVTSRKFEGIGCVSKVFSKHVNVNIGKTGSVKILKKFIDAVDTSKCKTITFHAYKNQILVNDPNLTYVILGNELMHYVGIGWVSSRVVDGEDLKKFPRVV